MSEARYWCSSSESCDGSDDLLVGLDAVQMVIEVDPYIDERLIAPTPDVDTDHHGACSVGVLCSVCGTYRENVVTLKNVVALFAAGVRVVPVLIEKDGSSEGSLTFDERGQLLQTYIDLKSNKKPDA